MHIVHDDYLITIALLSSPRSTIYPGLAERRPWTVANACLHVGSSTDTLYGPGASQCVAYPPPRRFQQYPLFLHPRGGFSTPARKTYGVRMVGLALLCSHGGAIFGPFGCLGSPALSHGTILRAPSGQVLEDRLDRPFLASHPRLCTN
jgi:hypothetical protein